MKIDKNAVVFYTVFFILLMIMGIGIYYNPQSYRNKNREWCESHGGYYAREAYNNHCEFPPNTQTP